MTPSDPRAAILLVEEDFETRQMLRTALETSGYRVLEAVNGIGLISKLAVDQPRLMVYEPATSWCRGLELVTNLSRHPQFSRVPVLCVSERRWPPDVVAGLAAGAVDYFTKPLALGAFLERVREIIETGIAEEAAS